MAEQTEPIPNAGEQQVSHAVGPATAPKKQAAINVDEMRDEFIKNAQPVADALRKKGKEQEATQLEQAVKIIGVAVGTQPQQVIQGDALKGESVSQVLKNIWDVIEKDPELKRMPQAQNLRKAGSKLDDAGLLSITVRNGVVVSFVGNFVENFNLAQKAVPTPAEKQPIVVKESVTSAARAPQAPPATVATQPRVPAAEANSATEATPSPLLVAGSLEKAKTLFQERMATPTQPSIGFTKADIPAPLLEKMGVKVEDLEKSGQLQKLLNGQKTDLITSFSLRNEQGDAIPFAAKLVLRRDDVGAPSLQFDLPKHQLVIPDQILGKEITPAMKEQLTKHGVVPLAEGFRDGKGQPFAAYMAIDKEMNRVVAVRREGIALPKEVLGVTLNPQQSKALLEGRPTKMEAMRNDKGQLFDATVLLDPVKRQLTFRDATPHVPQHKVEQVEPVVSARPRMRI